MKPVIVKFILLIGISFILQACSSITPQDAAKTTALVKLVDSVIQTGAAEDAVLITSLSEQEIDTIINALEEYKVFRELFKSPSPELYLWFETNYSTLVANYTAVEEIVSNHWAEYPDPIKLRLLNYQGYAKQLDTGISQAIAAKNQEIAVNNALQLGVLIAQIVAMY